MARETVTITETVYAQIPADWPGARMGGRMKLTKQQRLARLKPAVEIVEDELNRLPVRSDDTWERQDALMLSADMHNVIRHLKARWGELNAELNGGTDAER